MSVVVPFPSGVRRRIATSWATPHPFRVADPSSLQVMHRSDRFRRVLATLGFVLAMLAMTIGPAKAQVGDPSVTQVATGDAHSCALTSVGAVACWGVNHYGQLGDPANSGNANPNPVPLDVATLGSGMVAIAAGRSHNCALTSAGAVKCWGMNFYGQLGDPANSDNTNPNTVPLDVATLGSGVVAIAAGSWHSCALTSAGGVKCWGRNRFGELGSSVNVGTSNANIVPLDVATLGNGVVAIAAGDLHTCALTSAGAVKCWGSNEYGQLGNSTNSGTTNANNAPLDVATLGSGVVAIAVGNNHGCALTSVGEVKCWGRNNYGQLGSPTNSGTENPNDVPLGVATLGGGVVAIAAGDQHSCALTGTGTVKCWGVNRYGQLGNPTNSGELNPNPVPLDVATLGSGVAAIATGSYHSCALTSAGATRCWGLNVYGQLGSPVNSGIVTPNPVPLDVQTLSNIQPAGQAIGFNPSAILSRGASITLLATASSGEAVVFDTWTPATCSITGNTLTATSTALCGVRASQPGSASYAAAPQQLRLVRIVRSDALSVSVTGEGHVDVSPDPASGGIDACTEAASPCSATYGDADATALTLTATPATGWHLTGWSGDCTVDAIDPLQATVTLDAAKTCSAGLAIDSYAVTFVDWNGSVLSTQSVNHGSAATAPANPTRTGYTFSGWDVPFTNVTAALTVTAQYTINQYIVTATLSGSHGSITPPSQTVDHGNAASFTVTPDAGYHASVGGDACTPSDNGDGTWTASTVTQDCAVTASFQQNVAAAIDVHGGAPQSAPVAAAFSAALAVRVSDAADRPLQGLVVNFTAPSSGASAMLSSNSAITDANGIASITATANAIVGSYAVQASVTGAAIPASFALTNSSLASTITLGISPVPLQPGGSGTLTATVSGDGSLIPGGTVDFAVDGQASCAAMPLDANGIATCTIGPLAPGSHAASASYAGDAAHQPSVSNVITVSVAGAAVAVPVPMNAWWGLLLLVGSIALLGAMRIPRVRR